MVLRVEMSFEHRFEGIVALHLTDIRRESIPLFWSTVREGALAKGFCSNMGDTKYPCVCKTMKPPGLRNPER